MGDILSSSGKKKRSISHKSITDFPSGNTHLTISAMVPFLLIEKWALQSQQRWKTKLVKKNPQKEIAIQIN